MLRGTLREEKEKKDEEDGNNESLREKDYGGGKVRPLYPERSRGRNVFHPHK